jgi:hypothetical protein
MKTGPERGLSKHPLTSTRGSMREEENGEVWYKGLYLGKGPAAEKLKYKAQYQEYRAYCEEAQHRRSLLMEEEEVGQKTQPSATKGLLHPSFALWLLVSLAIGSTFLSAYLIWEMIV